MELFSTSDFPLITYLMYENQRVVNVDTSTRRAVFSFQDTAHLRKLVEDCTQRKAIVEPAQYHQVMKDAKDRIYNNNNNTRY